MFQYIGADNYVELPAQLGEPLLQIGCDQHNLCREVGTGSPGPFNTGGCITPGSKYTCQMAVGASHIQDSPPVAGPR